MAAVYQLPERYFRLSLLAWLFLEHTSGTSTWQGGSSDRYLHVDLELGGAHYLI